MNDLIFHFYTNGHKLLTNFSLMTIRDALMEIRVGKNQFVLNLYFTSFSSALALVILFFRFSL